MYTVAQKQGQLYFLKTTSQKLTDFSNFCTLNTEET